METPARHHRRNARVRVDRQKTKFLNFRHTGVSHIAQRGRDPRYLLAVVKMMGI